MELKSIAPPLRVSVTGWKGPLAEGEVDKAYEYGKKIAALLNEGATAGQ